MQINRQEKYAQGTSSIPILEETNHFDWIHCCCFRKFGEINSWWDYLKPYLEQSLQRYQEIVLLNSKEEGGKELIGLLRKELENDRFDIDDILDTDIVAVFINENNVSKIEILEAKPEKESQVEVMLKEYNGILRING